MSSIDLGQIKQQLPLAVQLNDAASFADFCWTGNALLQQQIASAVAPDKSARLLYLWGGSGSGKSHLLQACCQLHPSARYLPMHLLQPWDPAVLEGMEDHALIAIDDIDKIAGRPEWEEAVFHLFNRIIDGQSTLMMSAQTPPAATAIHLADLRSRLSSALVVQVHELGDEDKIATLQRRAQQRGLELPTAVGHYIVNRCARNMHALHAVLDRLDHASLVAQRKLTIPFVKDVLGV